MKNQYLGIVFYFLGLAGLSAQGVNQELDGALLIESEHLNLTEQWSVRVDSLSFASYIAWGGDDYFNEPGKGLVEIPISITNIGVYTLQWKSRIGEGSDPTEFNDTWLKFENANDFYGERTDGHIVYPYGVATAETLPEGSGKEGWFKVYLANDTTWTWSTNTSDNDGHAIKVSFEKPGEYKMLLSARSSNHQIDKIALYSGTVNPYNPQDKGEAIVSGDLMRWHNVKMEFAGPQVSETSTPNPFMDYKLDVMFTHEDGKIYKVPGYYAASNQAHESSSSAGNTWIVNFVPDRTGTWTWTSTFLEGKDVAVGGAGKSSAYIDGEKGSFQVNESNKREKDFRSPDLGKLKYVNEHYLRHAGTGGDLPNGNWFLKAGADAPENMLDYEGFDQTPNHSGRTKTWELHRQDFENNLLYDWKEGAGANILGVVDYLSAQGMNVFSFLVFNLGGDDDNVFPHLLKVTKEEYALLNDTTMWTEGVHHDRLDCSKLAQWEQLFSYADLNGMYLHFKLGEEENECKLDGGDLGRERKLFYRELIARFGHHMALNWNLGEENGPPVEPYMNDEQRKTAAQYFLENDPYQNHVVIHTRPDQQKVVYPELIGQSAFTGASVQTAELNLIHDEVLHWLKASADSGKKWVVANDEQGPYWLGLGVDDDYTGKLPSEKKRPDVRDSVRQFALWGTLMAGGTGVEYYYGYETGCGDLDCQDQRTRETKWKDAKVALDFFNEHLQAFMPAFSSVDDLTENPNDYVLQAGESIYVAYLPRGENSELVLSKKYESLLFDPIQGGELKLVDKKYKGLLNPPTTDQDWVYLIRKR
ncbi:MAG: DUF5060 domain-containing protein [Reichenbachiella sp.]